MRKQTIRGPLRSAAITNSVSWFSWTCEICGERIVSTEYETIEKHKHSHLISEWLTKAWNEIQDENA